MGQKGLFDNIVVRILLGLLLIVTLIGLIIVDLYIEKHGYLGFDGAPSFSAAFGFVSCVALVLIARLVRPLLMRGEDYYDD